MMDAIIFVDYLSYFYFCFNPRARDGRDRSIPQVVRVCLSFNPRARDGRDLSWLA